MASAQTAQSALAPTPVACLCVEDRQDVPAKRRGCEAAAAGIYAAGLIRPLRAEDTTTGLPGCDASGGTA